MLLDRVPSEAEFQPDLDVSTPLSVEPLSALEVIAGEASPAAGRLRSLAACGTDSGLPVQGVPASALQPAIGDPVLPGLSKRKRSPW